MPLPTPKSQSKKKFISSCMGNPTMNKDFSDNKQRAAVCYSQWEKKKSKASVVYQSDDDDEIIYENEEQEDKDETEEE
jgi:hypothetical protein